MKNGSGRQSPTDFYLPLQIIISKIKTEQNRQLARLNPPLLLGGEPRLINEWQIAMVLWDSIRFEADHNALLGLFIPSGASVPT